MGKRHGVWHRLLMTFMTPLFVTLIGATGVVHADSSSNHTPHAKTHHDKGNGEGQGRGGHKHPKDGGGGGDTPPTGDLPEVPYAGGLPALVLVAGGFYYLVQRRKAKTSP